MTDHPAPTGANDDQSGDQRPPVGRHLTPALHWVAWHAGELAAVATPLVLAVVVAPWLSALALAMAGGWLAHEIRQRRRRAHLAATLAPAVEASRRAGASRTTDEDSA